MDKIITIGLFFVSMTLFGACQADGLFSDDTQDLDLSGPAQDAKARLFILRLLANS